MYASLSSFSSSRDLRLPACTALLLPFAGAARIRSSPESSSSLFTTGGGAFFSSGSGSFAISTSRLDSLVSKDCVVFLVVTGAARFSPGGGSSSSSSSSSSRLNPSSDVDVSVVDMKSSSSPESSSPRRPQSFWLPRSLFCWIDTKTKQEAMIHNTAAAAATATTSSSSCSSSSSYTSALLKMKGNMR
ncbi:hypothetical protein EDB84DRAFT_1514541 [Lactarius hengduanensis]|nr:hypothetical protein EDB84DRAFT_1514541 [Lactarius hengduanensis]